MKKLIIGLMLLASISTFAEGYDCTEQELANVIAVSAALEMIKKLEPENKLKASAMQDVILKGLKSLADESVNEVPVNDESIKRNIYCGVIESNSKHILDFFTTLVSEARKSGVSPIN